MGLIEPEGWSWRSLNLCENLEEKTKKPNNDGADR